MKTLGIGIFLAIILYACGGETNANKADQEPESVAIDAQKLYKQNCVLCHGAYGDMGAGGAANLVESTLGQEERIAVISKGRAGTTMTPFESLLEAEEIKAIAEYTLTLGGNE